MLVPALRNPWRITLVAAVVAMVLAGSGYLGWTWRHPNAFADPGGWGVGFREADVGETFYVGMSYPRDRDGGHVTLHGGRANVVRGAANADTELLLCTLAAEANVGAIGTYVGDSIHDDCATIEPIAGEELDLHYSPLLQQVVLAVTLNRPGKVKVSSISLDYSDRWQTGTQRTGGEVVVSTGQGRAR